MARKIKKLARPKDRLETETRLLAAAREVFSEFGYEGATTRMIAEKSGVNLSLITRYFGGKRGILLATLQKERDAFWSSPLPYPEQESFTDECVCFAETRFKLMIEHVEFFKIVIVQIITDQELKEQILAQSFRSTGRLDDRLRRHLEAEKPEWTKDIAVIVDLLERVTLTTTILDFIISGKSEEECLKLINRGVSVISSLILSRQDFSWLARREN